MRLSVQCLVTALALMGSLPHAAAQSPGSEPPPTPESPPTPSASPPPAPAPAPQDAPQDAPSVRATYDAAFDALVRGDLPSAINGFRQAAAQSVVPETRAAASELARLASALQARPGAGQAGVAADLDRLEEDRVSGRTTFILSTTAAAFYSGIVLVDLLDAGDDFRAGVVVVVGSTAAGVLGSFYGSRGRTITEGMADSYTLGIGLGAANGLLLAEPLGLTDSSEEIETLALGALVVGGVGGMVLGSQWQPTRAQVSFTGNMGVMGIATAGLGLAIAQPDLDGDTILVLLAGALDAGTIGGVVLARDLDWSLSRARLVGLGTSLGALAGWAAAALLTGADLDEGGDRRARQWASATLAGMWGGFGLTWHLTRNMTPDRRFRADVATRSGDVLVVPTQVRGTPGIAITGSF